MYGRADQARGRRVERGCPGEGPAFAPAVHGTELTAQTAIVLEGMVACAMNRGAVVYCKMYTSIYFHTLSQVVVMSRFFADLEVAVSFNTCDTCSGELCSLFTVFFPQV